VGRRLGWIVVAVAIVLGVVWGFMPRPIVVDADEIRRGPLRVTLEEEAKSRVIDRYVVSAPVAGFARRLDQLVGDEVEHGTKVGELEPLRSAVLDPRRRAEAGARIKASKASLRSARERALAAEADAAYWTAELERIEQLFAGEAASRELLERTQASARQAQRNQRSAEFSIEVAEHEVVAAETALAYSGATAVAEPELLVIRSPVAGRILAIARKSEGVVQTGTPLLEIGDPRALEVEVEVLSTDAVQLAEGMAVELVRWGGELPLDGRVRTVEPVGFTKVSALGVEEQRVRTIVDITSPPERWTRLGDGYRLEARFILWHGDDVLQVPSSALFRRGDSWAVFVIEAGRAVERRVEVGRRGGLQTAVEHGLVLGDRVIVHPDETVTDGVRVRARG